MKNLCTLLLLLITIKTTAQQTMVYEDKVYRNEIKSVQLYPVGKESSFPLINLRGNDQLLLSFDDLVSRSKTYSYTIEHCDAEWNPSHLSPTEYLQGFTEDRISEYRYSSGTRQKYVHYELIFPNQSITPKIAGNYLLKVYEESDPSNPIITRRFYVLNSKAGIAADITVSPNTPSRETNQKINFQLDYNGLNVQNPYSDIRAFIMQNARPETGIMNSRPAFIRGTQLIYNDVNTNDFRGGNEFRHVDMRSLRLNSDRVGKMSHDTANTIALLTDHPRERTDYTFQYDSNGKYFIFNQEGRDSRTDGDYAHVYFTLATNKTDKDGAAYLVGQFNNYQLNADSKMDFDKLSNRFYTNQFLKQGVYDFEYVWIDATTGKPDDTILEGSHFETENDYQVLVYYRPVGARWDELVGFRLLNTGAKR